MPLRAGPPTASRTRDIAGTLKLLAYLALAIVLLTLDHRGGWLSQLRKQGDMLTQPVWWLAGLPGRVATTVRDSAATRSQLTDENRGLRNDLLVANARLARMEATAADNARLRALLATAQSHDLDVQLAPVLNIDLDPTRQRLVLAVGSNDGARIGQGVIDAGGLVGQIIQTTPGQATVLLLTDRDHAVPVMIARTGVRLLAYGTGHSDQLQLVNIPTNTDVQPGDVALTSGLGGRFPAGFPVGTVMRVQHDESRTFLVAELKPAAQLDRGRDVLLLREAGIGMTSHSAAENRESGMEKSGNASSDSRPSRREGQ
jgi:rod shape-determining protein MreC